MDDVGENLDGFGKIGGEGFGVIDGLLARSVSVEMGAHVLNLQLQLVLIALARSLERHVLEKVGDAVVAVILVSAGRGDGGGEEREERRREGGAGRKRRWRNLEAADAKTICLLGWEERRPCPKEDHCPSTPIRTITKESP